jgi:thioredoxin reductase (NADPH)
MQDHAFRNPKIAFIWDSVVEEIYGDPKGEGVTGVRLKNVKTGKTTN